METTVIAVIGSKSSGKTTTIEVLTKMLTKKGYVVAAVKHIPELNFTIDREEKDTWRFAKAGAQKIVSVASDEIATVEKIDTTSFSLEEILQRCKNVDLVFLEGFKKLVGKNNGLPKIVTVKSAEEAVKASKAYKSILAFTGSCPTETLNLKTPYINVLKNPERIAEMVERIARKK